MSRVSGVAELVRAMLLRGELRPGRRVVELHLVELLHVGRSTVREALRKLEGEGLLTADHAGGMRVITVDAAQLEDILRVRVALEALGAGLAASAVREGRVAPGALRELGDLATAADAAARGAAGGAALHADRHVHRAVTALGGCSPCSGPLEHVWDRIVMATADGVAEPARIIAAGRDHDALLAAIAAGDAEDASAIARRHALAALRGAAA